MRCACARAVHQAAEIRVQVERFAHGYARPAGHACRERGVADSALDRAGQRLHVMGRHQQARVFVAHHLGNAPDLARDDRDAARHRLDDRVGQTLRERGMTEHVAGCEQVRHVVHVAEERHPLAQPEMVAQVQQPLTLIAITRDEEAQPGARIDQALGRKQEVVEPLHRAQSRDAGHDCLVLGQSPAARAGPRRFSGAAYRSSSMPSRATSTNDGANRDDHWRNALRECSDTTWRRGDRGPAVDAVVLQATCRASVEGPSSAPGPLACDGARD